MKRIYLDSSAYVKAFVDEDGSRSVKALLTATENNKVEIFLSQWAINESIKAVDVKCYQKKMMTAETRNQTIGRVLRKSIENSTSASSNFTIVPVDRELVKLSNIFIYSELHLSADDALHLCTAFYYNCEYLITSDTRLKRQAHNQVVLPQGVERPQATRIQVLDASDAMEMGDLLKSL